MAGTPAHGPQPAREMLSIAPMMEYTDNSFRDVSDWSAGAEWKVQAVSTSLPTVRAGFSCSARGAKGSTAAGRVRSCDAALHAWRVRHDATCLVIVSC